MALRSLTMIRNESMILLRDSSVLFWTLLFPFFFLAMMLFTYGRDGRMPTQVIEIVDLDGSAAAQRYEARLADTFSAREFLPGTLHPARAQAPIAEGALRITIPEDFGYAIEHGRGVRVTVTFDKDGVPAQLAARVVRAASLRFDADEAGREPMVDVVVDERGAEPAFSFTHYTLTGALVMSMMSAGMTTICVAIAYRRERNGFKMMACFPVSAASFLASMLVSRMLLLVTAAFVLLFGARALFGIPLVLDAGRLAQTGVVVLVGGTMLLTLGIALAARLATVSAATFVTSLVYIALLFLSDLTMPLAAMPASVAAVMEHLPTARFVDALRHVLLRDDGLAAQRGALLEMAAWTALFALVAARTFRWHRR
jgi:ABC-2 type transport system permease protein